MRLKRLVNLLFDAFGRGEVFLAKSGQISQVAGVIRSHIIRGLFAQLKLKELRQINWRLTRARVELAETSVPSRKRGIGDGEGDVHDQVPEISVMMPLTTVIDVMAVKVPPAAPDTPPTW